MFKHFDKTLFSLLAIAIVITLAALLIAVIMNYQDSGISEIGQPTGEVAKKEQACINAGGTVTTATCCESAEDFPNECLIGACGCSLESSHEIKIGECGEGKCCEGDKCVAMVAGRTVFCCDTARLDLNSDGIEESITFEGERGASGNGPIFIYQEINGSQKKIGDLEGNLVFINEEKTDEYYNLTTYWHLGAGTGNFCNYQWDKSRTLYYQVSCETDEISIEEEVVE